MTPTTRQRRETEARVEEGVEVRWIDPRDLVPAHPAHDEGRLEELVASMDERGWDGMPILTAGTYVGVTGAHRIEAARRVGLDAIPCVRTHEVLEALGEDPDTYRSKDGTYETDSFYRIDGMERWGVEF